MRSFTVTAEFFPIITAFINLPVNPETGIFKIEAHGKTNNIFFVVP